MEETDRIRNAWMSVSTLATNSEYYDKDIDYHDINLIAKIVKKEIPKKPYFESDGDWEGEPVYDTWICPNCCEHYETECDHYDYCPKCGQRIDWSDEE